MDSLTDVFKTLLSGKKALTTDLTGQASESGDGIIATSYANNAVLKKQAYGIRQTYTIIQNSEVNILFDPSLYGDDVFLVPFRIATTVGAIEVSLTTDFVYTAADTEPPIFNRYGLTDNPVHKMGVFQNITGLVVNSEPLKYAIGSRSTNQSSGGGSTAGSQIFLFEKDKKYLLTFKNNLGATDPAIISLQFDWFEE